MQCVKLTALPLHVRWDSIGPIRTVDFKVMAYIVGRSLAGSYVQFVMSGGTQVSQEVAHRRENFKGSYKKMASENYQETHGGTLSRRLGIP